MSGTKAWVSEMAALYVPGRRRPPAAHPPATLPARPAAETLTATVAQIISDPAFVDRLAEAVTARRATATPPPAGQPVPAGKPGVPPTPTTTRTTRTTRATAGVRTAPAPPPVWPAGGLDLSAARAARADEQLPAQPVTASVFTSGGTWRWTDVAAAVPGGRLWEPLARGLTASGPWRAVRIRTERLTAASGEARFRRGDDGQPWADIALDPGLGHEDAQRTLAHELAHLADETAARASTTASAWQAGFHSSHRLRDAEAFAVACETWVTPRTTAAELLEAARRHQRERGRRA